MADYANWITALATATTAIIALIIYLGERHRQKNANLNLSMRTIFSCPEYVLAALVINNDGPARARDVEIAINDTPFDQYKPANERVGPQPNYDEIDPKAKVELALYFGGLSPLQNVIVKWSDNTKQRKSIRALLRPR